MAAAEIPMTAATAVSGPKKRRKGRARLSAKVTVRPGIEPKIIPYREPIRRARRVSGLKRLILVPPGSEPVNGQIWLQKVLLQGPPTTGCVAKERQLQRRVRL
jgi:hypothetical protein